jgi:ABC-type lipoprotein export system ATPase subunit
MPSRDVLVRLRNVSKDYRGLRPLRIETLDVHEGQRLALVGVDQMMAEVLVDLITAAIVPDQGDVEVFGQPTRQIADREAWLQTVDQFGLLTERAVLLDQLTVAQNLALPLSIELEQIAADVQARVEQLASELDLTDLLAQPAGALSPLMRLRVRLGRALALSPRVVLAEHPNATLSADEQTIFASDLSRILTARGVAGVVLTASHGFARAAAEDVLVLQPATGALTPSSGWRRWFS